MGLYTYVFEEMGAEQYVRLVQCYFSWHRRVFFRVVQQYSTRILSHFVLEASQNLLRGLVLTYVLWGAMLKLRETRTRLIQLVLALGLYFSVFAASYALRNLYTSLDVFGLISSQFRAASCR